MRTLGFVVGVFVAGSCARGVVPNALEGVGASKDDGSACGADGVEMDDTCVRAPKPDGGPCDVDCRAGRLCLVRPEECRKAPILVAPSEYLAPK